MAGEIKAPDVWEADPTRVKRIAVMQGGRTCVYEHVKGVPLWASADMGLLASILFVLHEQCQALWLMPPHAGDISAALRELLNTQPFAERIVEGLSSDGHLAGLRISRVQDGRKVGAPFLVFLCDIADHWGIAGKLAGLTPAQLAEGLMLAAHLLDMQLRFSPSYVGLQVMRQVLARARVDITPLSPWAEELVQAHRPTYVQWSKEIPLSEIAPLETGHGISIHKYDRNSSFLASAGEVPVGDPVATDMYQPGCPGLYRIVAVPNSPHAEYGGALPGPVHVGEGAGEYPRCVFYTPETWAWEPQMRLLFARNYDVQVFEGYYWPKSQKHDLLRPWRERMWRAREAAEAHGGPAGAVAKILIKKASVAAVGRLNQRAGYAVMSLDEAEARDRLVLSHETDRRGRFTGMVEAEDDLGKTDLKTPHWWSTIIANANERLFSALYEHQAYHPIAAYVDAVYCLSPWPTEHTSAQLGKFKPEWSLWLTRDQVDAYNDLDSTALRIKYLARIARAQGVEIDDGETEEAEA